MFLKKSLPEIELPNLKNFVMEVSRTPLPPIETLLNGFPTMDILATDPLSASQSENEDENSKTPQYTLADDLLILQTIKSYYGTAFRGRVPWSFWQTFRKVTGNTRSSSSLYHHWNGAMRRKYGAYLSRGQIDECLSWIEQAMASGKQLQRKVMEVSGSPLTHNWSLPPVPITGGLPCQPLALQRQNSSRT